MHDQTPHSAITFWKCASLALVIMLWDGIPVTLFGLQHYNGMHLSAAVILFSFALMVINIKRQEFNIWLALPLITLMWFIFVTVVSSQFIFNQPLGDWVLAMYSIVPLGLIVLVLLLKFTFDEIVSSILLVTAIVTVLVVLDQIFHLPFGEKYIRASTTDLVSRRTVILKTEMSMGAVIVYIRLLRSNSVRGMTTWGASLVCILAILLLVMESRLTLAATIAAIAMVNLVSLFRDSSLKALFFSSFGMVLFVPIAVYRFFGDVNSVSDYVNNDVSIQWRLITVNYYEDVFRQTGGLGFGIMSASPDASNPLSFGQWREGVRYGTDDYNLYLADTGIYSSLFQFGYIGFVLVVTLSFIAIRNLMKGGWKARDARGETAFALGALMLFYVLSPWPTNFFSLEWSIMSGAVFWCLAATWCLEKKRLYTPQLKKIFARGGGQHSEQKLASGLITRP